MRAKSSGQGRVASGARRALVGLALGVGVSAAALIAASALQACSAESQTSGRRIALGTEVELDPAVGPTFETALGWTVTLSKAVIATGPFYYFDGAPPLVQLGLEPRTRRFALRALGLGIAHAHPGHYEAGNALGQMLEPWSVDLLAGAAELPMGEGVTGVYRSARFSFAAAPAGPMMEELSGYAAVVEGRAEKEGELPRLFRAAATLADVVGSAAAGEVDGCEFRALEVEADGRVTVSINPRVWLDLADFSELEASDGERVELPPGSQPQIAFAQGLAQLSAYKFSHQPEVAVSVE